MSWSGFLLILVTIALSCTGKKEDPDCSRFRLGKFEYRGSTGERFTIERSDSIQIESDNSTGITMKFKVKWVEPCVCEFHFYSYLINGRDSIVGTPEDPLFPSVRSRIIETTRNYYISESTLEGEKIRSRDTILKLE